MEKSKEIKITAEDGVEQTFIVRPFKLRDLGLLKSAINSGIFSEVSTESKGSDSVGKIMSAVAGSIELIGADGVSSLGSKTPAELEAILGSGYAVYDLLTQAFEYQKDFCGAYQSARSLISMAAGFLSSGNMA